MWDQARENVESAQIRYKKSAQEIAILAGERVMVKREAGKKGKLSCRYEGRCRVSEVRCNTVEIRPVEQPDGPTEIANISRICQCQSEVPEGVLKNQRDGFVVSNLEDELGSQRGQMQRRGLCEHVPWR